MIEWHDIWYWPKRKTCTLHVYIPGWYYDSTERLPVMYFFDGNNLFLDEHATYGRSWRLSRFLDRWEKPMIVVGIDCPHDGEDTFQWILSDVKQTIDAQYRTWPHREATGIAGAGDGGLLSLYGAVCHNATFGKAASLSGGIRFHKKELARYLMSSNISPDTRVYLSWGEHESGRIYEDGSNAEQRAIDEVVDTLADRGVATMVHCQPSGRHHETHWEKQVPQFMDFLWLDRRW